MSCLPKERHHATVPELAKSLGKSTGIVATVHMQHAASADFSAHTAERTDYENIAAQMLETGVDVVLYSYLPEDKRMTGLFENTEIADAICNAWGAKRSDNVCPHLVK